ncbi:Piso0_004260 [Millerozyma farinosa CBS 7064]|uniref:Piso0_004260 protein n=1 Tax=Pichia sorbitophila (strain ATCC MYA-4447 / BCRC 22081 / CBS 7064 / NBRC 10061 / NRRL Y-12695) TaxID=559304 RepID=G8Y7X6_PICSO|nr:Piso0_004260 [Millerozyma farinosa CBS 7064]CCE84706.1 Piso0_004260 [Millerozyma farinosa CBS 7064]
MNGAECGPSNALTKLQSHTAKDNSLQREFNRGFAGAPGQFRGVNVDRQLNQDFREFSQGGRPGVSRANVSLHTYADSPGLSLGRNIAPGGASQAHGASEKWVDDFAQLNIQKRDFGQRHAWEQSQRGDWQKQFMLQQSQQSQQGAMQNQQQRQNQYQGQYMGQYLNQNQFGRLGNDMIELSHSGMVNGLHDNSVFDDQFKQLERELQEQNAEQQQEQPEVVYEDVDNQGFSEAARDVRDAMLSSSGSTGVKFRNSDFFHLMESVAEKRVQISQDGKSLEQRASAPPASSVPQQQHPNHPRDSLKHYLPDPLSHVKDGALDDFNSPLAAAKAVSGNQVSTSDWIMDDDWLDMTAAPTPAAANASKTTALPERQKVNLMPAEWQEVYDDYRHDDDFQ